MTIAALPDRLERVGVDLVGPQLRLQQRPSRLPRQRAPRHASLRSRRPRAAPRSSPLSACEPASTEVARQPQLTPVSIGERAVSSSEGSQRWLDDRGRRPPASGLSSCGDDEAARFPGRVGHRRRQRHRGGNRRAVRGAWRHGRRGRCRRRRGGAHRRRHRGRDAGRPSPSPPTSATRERSRTCASE